MPNEIFALEINPYYKLILAYLYSKSDDFIHYQSFISDKLGISRMTVSRAIKFLTTNGYLVTNDGGKTYFPVIGENRSSVTNSYNSENQTVTDSYNPTVTNRTESVTNRTQVSLTVTPRATDSYTTKKTDIQRLNNKIEKTPIVEPSPEATVLKGVSEQEKSPTNNDMNQKVIDIVNHFNQEQIMMFNQLNSDSQDELLSKFNLDSEKNYLDILQIKRLLKEKCFKANPRRIDIEEPKAVQSSNQYLSLEDSTPFDVHEMFNMHDNF